MRATFQAEYFNHNPDGKIQFSIDSSSNQKAQRLVLIVIRSKHGPKRDTIET